MFTEGGGDTRMDEFEGFEDVIVHDVRFRVT